MTRARVPTARAGWTGWARRSAVTVGGTLFGVAALLFSAAAPPRASGGDPPPSATPGPTIAAPPKIVHLVGHEEVELLERVQDVIDDWDPRRLRNPYVETLQARDDAGVVRTVKRLLRPDLGEFIADPAAAEALGKALFWEMRAGSDFRREPGGKFVGTACASCHYRHGADARNRNTKRIPYVVWDKYDRHEDHPLVFGDEPQPYSIAAESKSVFTPPDRPPLHLIVGSQGVRPLRFQGLNGEPSPGDGAWPSEKSAPRTIPDGRMPPEWAMFVDPPTPGAGGRPYRRITTRNSPTVFNSVFSDRQFHDGRAESTFNGFSIFGDHDHRSILFRRDRTGRLVPAHVAITNASLASQAVGPIVNEVEMSYLGRTFHDLAVKLLDEPILEYQTIDPTDGVLRPYVTDEAGTVDPPASRVTYRTLIQRAFRREWWDGGLPTAVEADARTACPPKATPGGASADGVPAAEAAGPAPPDPDTPAQEAAPPQSPDQNAASPKPGPPAAGGPGADGGGKGRPPHPEDSQQVELRLTELCGKDPPLGTAMQANFSLYWGLSILMYEASLVTNQSPFDAMMQGDGRPVEALYDRLRAENELPETILLDRTTRDTVAQPRIEGTALFQRGFRVFMNRGCIECHSGPLFSEAFDRIPFDDNARPIAATLDRTLIPNAQGDAIAISLEAWQRTILDRIRAKLAALAGANRVDVGRLVRDLDFLRHAARGRRDDLIASVRKALEAAPLDAGPAAEIAEDLLAMETDLALHVSNRPFLTEAERIALAELVVEPVDVERMAIPFNQVATRRPLPFRGLPAREAYSFYDLAFYNVGAGVPRYDAGVGGFNVPVAETRGAEPEAAPAVAAARVAGEAKVRRDNEVRQAVFGAPGSAYRLKRPTLPPARPSVVPGGPPDGVPRAIQSSEDGGPGRPLGKSLDPKGLRPRDPAPGPGLGPSCDLDAHTADEPPPADASWDRNFLPKDERRSSLHFLSRARELVLDEEPWGHRKPFLHDNELAFWGAFKTPTLRNVALTRPYMHNGRLQTLLEVVKFYNRAGDVPRHQEHNPDKHPAIVPLNMTDDDIWAVVFFLHCLTDCRLERETAPFDHPSLRVVNGFGDGDVEAVIDIDSVGAAGHAHPLPLFPSDR